MNNEYDKQRARFIRETFKDERKIKCAVTAEELQIDDDVYQGGFIYKTEDGNFIDLEFQEKDFNVEELAKYVELAEDIDEKHHKQVSIYILCCDNINVCVREFPIKSEADFTIKIAKMVRNTPEEILNRMKRKIRNNEPLSESEISELENSTMKYSRKERHKHRIEVFKIMNRIY